MDTRSLSAMAMPLRSTVTRNAPRPTRNDSVKVCYMSYTIDLCSDTMQTVHMNSGNMSLMTIITYVLPSYNPKVCYMSYTIDLCSDTMQTVHMNSGNMSLMTIITYVLPSYNPCLSKSTETRYDREPRRSGRVKLSVVSQIICYVSIGLDCQVRKK